MIIINQIWLIFVKIGGIEQVQDVFLKVLILMAWILFTMIKKNLRVEFPKKPMKTRLKIL